MKKFLVMLFCLLVGSVDAATARPLQFRGQFVETYTKESFQGSLPQGVELACRDSLCSFSSKVRIYVFEHNGRRENFWSADYCDVMFDEAETLRACGDSDQTVYHDEANQLLFRHSGCDEPEHYQVRYFFSFPKVTAKQLH